MLEETVKLLKPGAGRTIVDCTLGFGGHAAALLAEGAMVIGIDQDADALAASKQKFSNGERITFVRANFSDLKNVIREKTDGFLFDLGVSSYQIDRPERGFSIRYDGPLDMRMDQSQPLSAREVLNDYSPEELEKIFFEYGEERFGRRIARAVAGARQIKEIATTGELKEIVEKAIPTWRKRESVSRIFQAIRIEVNGELDRLNKALAQAVELLKPGGRIVVISYHSLEDRAVKKFFVECKKNGILEVITKKPLTASIAESAANPRAKSAKLRCAEKK